MKIHDAGISGSERTLPSETWQDLGLPPLWQEIIEILCPASSPRPIQIDAIRKARLLESRRNLLVSAPTNSGKTLVGLLALLDAVRRGKRAVLLEPLRALAQEKADWLETLTRPLSAALGRPFSLKITTGDYRLDLESYSDPPPTQGELIIATPERFEAVLRQPQHDAWLETIEAVCLDEAHLLASPRRGITLEYLLTSLLCRPMPPRLVLLSATLGETAHLTDWLAPCDALCTAERFPPLQKEVWELDAEEKPDALITQFVRVTLAQPGASLLLYVYQTRSAERLASLLCEQLPDLGHKNIARAYHARMSASARDLARSEFERGTCPCLVSTTALGLGVNLPATHVLLRDTTFPGVGRLEVAELLQMMGRAGRGARSGHAIALVRPNDSWTAPEMAQSLREETVSTIASPFLRENVPSRSKTGDREMPLLANCIAAYLARSGELGYELEEIQRFFVRSLAGQKASCQVPSALAWLSDPRRVLAYRDDLSRYHPTRLGLAVSRATIPLPFAAGLAQLLRDLFSIDPDDQLLAAWKPLDFLLILHLFSDQPSRLRPYSHALAEQVEAWIESTPGQPSLLYRKWIAGAEDASRSDEILGSLGIANPGNGRDRGRWAQETATLALFHAILLTERSQGKEIADIERQWKIQNLEGIEERWRDEILWLLSGLVGMLELPCFYFHLKSECDANPERLRRIKRELQRLVHLLFDLRENLTFCSPLGAFLRSLRRSTLNAKGKTIGIRSIRRLESAGLSTTADLARLSLEDLLALGLTRKNATQILAYFRRRMQ